MQRRETIAPVAVVYVDALLGQLTTGQGGFAPYVSRSVTLSGRRFAHSLVTAAGIGLLEQTSTLVIGAKGRYETLLATIGRDDSEAADGPACAYFEVWGDNRRLFRSDPLRSPAFLVRTRPGVSVRQNAQEVRVDTRGVGELRLVTRYATDIGQTGANLNRARGCAWGDACFLPVTAPVDTFRDVLRPAVARLGAGAMAFARAGIPPRTLPLRLAIAPFRAGKNDLPGGTESAQALLLELLQAAHGPGGETVFQSIDRRAQSRLSSALSPSRAGTDSLAVIADAGKRANADLVVTGVYAPSTIEAGAGALELALVDIRGVVRVASASVSLALALAER